MKGPASVTSPGIYVAEVLGGAQGAASASQLSEHEGWGTGLGSGSCPGKGGQGPAPRTLATGFKLAHLS